MKKAVLAICTLVTVLSCGMLMPMTVRAEEKACPPHAYGSFCEGYSDVTMYVHQYVISNGPTGPVYGSCRVYKRYRQKYNVCSLCGYIDYANPIYSAEYAIFHESCGVAPYYY
ncbi:MAG: hypothetical protein K5678_12030 [Acetatifactor sp.]|nr:hypothetical protein [Acetatifactor sp.]